MLSTVPAGLRPPICYITATHSKILRLLKHDVIINHLFSLLFTLYIILSLFCLRITFSVSHKINRDVMKNRITMGQTVIVFLYYKS